MIQAGFVSQHVCYHFVLDADVPPRTHEDVLRTGIWSEEWNPEDMLCEMIDGNYSQRQTYVFTYSARTRWVAD